MIFCEISCAIIFNESQTKSLIIKLSVFCKEVKLLLFAWAVLKFTAQQAQNTMVHIL